MKRKNRKKGPLVWGFVWLAIQIALIWIYIKTRNGVTIIPLPLAISFWCFKIYFKLKSKHKQKREKTYGVLKFKYNKNIKLRKATQQRAIKDYNHYVLNFYRKHKKYPNRYQLGRIVRGSSHETIEYRRSKKGHWPRQWLRKYIYGLHGIKYTMR